MTKNEKVLDAWFAVFKDYKRLTLKEAQELYLKMKMVENEAEKKAIKEELLFGTMYVLYNQLKSSSILYFQTRGMDVEDVIQFSLELWMHFIWSDKILGISFYSYYFHQTFYNDLHISLYSEKLSCFDFFACHNEHIIKLFTKYIALRKEKLPFDFQEFQRVFPGENVYVLYDLFEKMYQMLVKLKILKNGAISERQMSTLFFVFVEAYLNSPSNMDEENFFIDELDYCNQSERKVLRERVREIFSKVYVPSKRDKLFLANFCGLYENQDEFGQSVFVEKMPKEQAEIGRENHLTRERVRQLIGRSGSWIRKSHYAAELQTIQEELEYSRR